MKDPSFSKIERVIFYLTLTIFLYSVVKSGFNQNDFNLVWFYLLVFTITLAAVIFVRFISKSIPYIRPSLYSIAGSIFILWVAGLPIPVSSAFILVVFTINVSIENSIRHLIFDESLSMRLKYYSSFILSVILLSGLGYFFSYDRMSMAQPRAEDDFVIDKVSQIADSSIYELGESQYSTFSYGSGSDKHRPEYGLNTKLVTSSVDGRPFMARWKGLSGWLRRHYWGFDLSALPLNALVWMPEGRGPFPLVIITHGDHAMKDSSERGYEYIAKGLVDRDYIVVSVDHNFLNSSWSDRFLGDSTKNQSDARAWLILAHLRAWRQWNNDQDNFLYNKVDLDSIALIGHAQGGDAALVASRFNSMQTYPKDPSISFDYSFGIQSVISIAPTGSFYRMDDETSVTENINYMLLQGTHDGEQNFTGRDLYSRVVLPESAYALKVAKYIYGANHGQFNSTWGENDGEFYSPFVSRWDLKRLLSAQQQQKWTAKSITAFLEYTLREVEQFKDHIIMPSRHDIGIPQLIQFQESGFVTIEDFEQAGAASGLSTGGSVVTERRSVVEYANAITVEWSGCATEAAADNCWVNFPVKSGVSLEGQSIQFDLASYSDFEIDFTVQFIFEGNEHREVLLSSFSFLPKQYKRSLLKVDRLTGTSYGEVAFQTYTFVMPESDEGQIGRLSDIRFVFNKSTAGSILIDNIRLSQP